MSWLRKVFELNPAGLNWPRAVMILDVLLVPLVVFWAIGYEQYLLSAVFGLVFAALVDPGGGYAQRAWHVAVFIAGGAGVTALGFAIGGDAWGWLVLAAFGVTLAASLAVMFGVHRFVAALLLNIWFIVAVALAAGLHGHTRVTSYTWAQVVAGTVALAFGLNLSHGYWMPIAAIVAMKPGLEQTTVTALQRLAGALMGAIAAALLLLIPANVHGLRLFAIDRGLEVVAIVLLIHGVGTRFWNYAFYCGAVAALLAKRQAT